MPEVFDRFFALLGTSTEEQLDLRLLDPGYRIFPEPGGDEPFTVPLGEQRVLCVAPSGQLLQGSCS